MHAHVIPAASLPSSLAALTPRTTTTPTDAHFYARMNSFAGNSSVDCISYLDREHLRELAEGVLDIPESEDRFFTLSKPEGTDILPLPRWLSDVYVLKWANPTRIGGGAGAAYSLDVTAGEPGRARTRHLYITYMGEAGPSRCRVALATAIQHLGPILYTAEEDARRVSPSSLAPFTYA
ncbi:hypothetical protein BDW22DRAFT_617823 [Trametopsis cervina]|nr:hypothetical protein BDW22DRAFT_617823 [Trametopsis cervina]